MILDSRKALVLGLAVLFFTSLALGFMGCERLDTKLDVPDGKNSGNDRYADDDIIGPVLKLKLKPTPEQEQKEQQKIEQQTMQSDY